MKTRGVVMKTKEKNRLNQEEVKDEIQKKKLEEDEKKEDS